MLTLDTQQQARQKVIDNRLAARDEMQRWAAEQYALSSVFLDGADPTDPEKQWGRTMSSTVLSQIIRKLNPSLLIEVHPTNPTLVVVSALWAGRYKATVCIYGSGTLPEYSIMTRQEHVTERPLPVDDEGNEVLSAKDNPDRVRQAVTRALEEIFNNPTVVYDEDSAVALLEKTITEARAGESLVHDTETFAGREQVRGWRTALVRLVQQGLASIEKVEALIQNYKGPDRQSWAVKTGKREETCLM